MAPWRQSFRASSAQQFERITMGKFDSRKSQKMCRKKAQRKKKERLKRRAEETRAARKG